MHYFFPIPQWPGVCVEFNIQDISASFTEYLEFIFTFSPKYPFCNILEIKVELAEIVLKP